MSDPRTITFSGYVVDHGGVVHLGNGLGFEWPLHQLIAEEWPASPVVGARLTWAFDDPGSTPAQWAAGDSVTDISGDLHHADDRLEVAGEVSTDVRADLLAHVGEYVFFQVVAG